MTREEMAELLDEKLDEKLQPLWQAVGGLRRDVSEVDGRIQRLEDRLTDGLSALRGAIETVDFKITEERAARRAIEKQLRELQPE